MVSVILRKLVFRLLELVYPPDLYCICCGDFIERGTAYSLCGACVRGLHWITGERCPKCGRMSGEYELCLGCREHEPVFASGFSCVTYGMLEKDMIHRLKYKGQAYLSRCLGLLMAERLEKEQLPIDFIVEVPMYKKKLAKRGYNQAALLAEAVSKHTGVPWLKDTLVRVKDTIPMTELDRADREENIKNAFTVWDESAKMIQKKTLLLVDDVYTTGSTADHCSRQLLEAGAEAVYVLTFAAGAGRSTIEIA